MFGLAEVQPAMHQYQKRGTPAGLLGADNYGHLGWVPGLWINALPNNLGPGGKAPQATLYLITLPSTGIIWSTTPSTLILSSSFHPGARLSKPNLPQTSQGQ